MFFISSLFVILLDALSGVLGCGPSLWGGTAGPFLKMGLQPVESGRRHEIPV